MAAEKKPIIVIKKINVQAAGAHGGSWKVAFADFMTAMMAFFLVMWLVNQSEEVKKSVSEYFSTPSIIEYNFSNYGVELTLEKLFLDLMNEPLKAFEQFITPADRVPNIMDMGTTKIQLHFVAEQLGEFANNVDVNQDEITFEIPDIYLFAKNSARPGDNFVMIMEKVRALTEGLKDADVFINSELPYTDTFNAAAARNVAEQRLDLLLAKVESGIRGPNVDLYGKTTVEKIQRVERRKDDRGVLKFRIKKKDFSEEEKRQRTRAAGALEHAPKVSQSGSETASDNARTPSSEAPSEVPKDEMDSFIEQMAAPDRKGL